jgi:hypothetical protein
MQPLLDVRALVEEVVAKIIAHQADDRLKWHEDGSVRG